MSPPSLRSGRGSQRAVASPPSAHGSNGGSVASDASEDTIIQQRKEIRQQRDELAEARRRIAVLEEDARMPSTSNNQPEPQEDGRSARTREWVEESTMTQMLAALQLLVKRSEQATPTSLSDVSQRDDSRMNAFLARQSGAKDLPEFTGNPLEWKAFKGQYDQSTAMCNLSPAENLLRLQRALKGLARETVSSMLVDPKNVGEVIDALETRFGCPESIVNAVLSNVQKLTPLPMDASPEAAVNLGLAIKNVVATIEGIHPEYLTSPQLLSELVWKMPPWMRWSWSERCDPHISATVKELGEYLLDVGRRAACGGALRPPVAATKPGKARRDKVFTVKDNTVSKVCPMCKGHGHGLATCSDYLAKSVADRWTSVRSFRICYMCFESGHGTHTCRKTKCGDGECRGLHHKTLHRDTSANGQVLHTRDNGKDVLLKVVPVKISGPGGHADGYALLDDGSNVSLIDARVAAAVGAAGSPQALSIHGASGMCVSDTASRRVKLRLRGADTSEFVISANTVRKLNLPQLPVARQSDMVSVKPILLLGQDNVHLLVPREVRQQEGRRFMSRTALGWTTHGGIRQSDTVVLAIKSLPLEDNMEKLIAAVKFNFGVDSLGVCAAPRVSEEERRAVAIMKATTWPLASGQWATGLLWREDESRLPDNRHCAASRLQGLERKFERDPALARAYRDKVSDLVTKGYARLLTAAEAAEPGPRKWYLPHFAVFHPNKPGKIRVVFDAASKCRGVSLNDKLLPGPDLLSSLLGNILRFREGKVAVAADIKEMFLRIRIHEPDQKSQLFLWRTTPGGEVATYQLTSMMFGATCSPSSAQYVRDRVAAMYEQEDPAAAKAIREKFYMDDFLDAAFDSQEAAARVRGVRAILQRGGFHLTNWASNDATALQAVPAGERAATGRVVEIVGCEEVERVLGVLWDTATDAFTFTFPTHIELAEVWPTKRSLLSEAMKIFDPVGFISCLTVRTKIILQAVWRSAIEWDDRVMPEHAERWREWARLMATVNYSIPRCCVSNAGSRLHLHIFCDASEEACCTVAYLIDILPQQRKVAFMASKCKVAPLRPTSIPRLELQAALMGARLATTIRRECRSPIEKTVLWTDSTTVLSWIRSDPRRYCVYVANRLGEIDETTTPQDWRWVPTAKNPADIGTRDAGAPDMSPDGMWYGGPAFLRDAEDKWPVQRDRRPPPEAAQELRAEFTGVTAAAEEAAVRWDNFSSWTRLVRSFALALRFVARCRAGATDVARGALTAAEMSEAELALTKLSQRDAYGTDIDALLRGEPVARGSRLIPLNPTLDERGVLRMGTRLHALEGVPGNLTAPVILDGAHPYTRLLIRHFHMKEGHHYGVERAIADLRCDYFIMKLRTTVRKVVHDCIICRLKRLRPQPPLMGQLPAGRMAHHERPFSHCGLDFFGPMMTAVGRRKEKRYGVLFTCMVTRAIHLEMTSSLSSDAAIMAIRRMTARRGQPHTFYSDNGTNLRGADKEMREAICGLKEDEKMLDEMACKRTTWRFNPPGSPHMGGAWERLVRSVKTALTAILKERTPREETLATALAEAEHVVNSRPLTHVSADPRDEAPLTPNHFLLGSAGGRPHLALYGPQHDDVCLRKQWRVAQQLADMFWRRWTKEYLPTLAQRKKWRELVEPVKVGDLVVVTDGALPRGVWPRGRVIEVLPAKDGQVRIVRIKTATGIYTRPTVKVAVLKL